MSTKKISEIDKKIKELKEKKLKLEQKQFDSFGKIFARLEFNEWDEDVLIGALLSLKETPNKKEEWRKAGLTFRQDKIKSKSQNEKN